LPFGGVLLFAMPVALGGVLAARRHLANVSLGAPHARLAFWAGVAFSLAYVAVRAYVRL
jgi:hypothetical protein